jgi:hypothetical protein
LITGRYYIEIVHIGILAELGFSSDLGFQMTVDRKQHKYAPLIKELEEEG